MQFYQGKIEKHNLELALKTFFMPHPFTKKKEEKDILKINMEVLLNIKKDSDFTDENYKNFGLIYEKIAQFQN
jgi:hypothetical protein